MRAGNGYAGDVHEFLVTDRDTAVFLIYSSVVGDTSSVGGDPDMPVFDAIVQEVDIATGAVLFEWHSIGPVPLDESYLPLPEAPADPWDYLHPNSIDIDTDGDLLVSARHTSTVYKIDYVTGALGWCLGGKRSNFAVGRRARFDYQHDAQRQADGSLTIFDNSATSDEATAKQSRGIFLRLDEERWKARLEREVVSTEFLSRSQGNMQVLPNGNVLMGWGNAPALSEVAPDGKVVFELRFPLTGPTMNANSYRAFRFEWQGEPADTPAVVATRTAPTAADVRVSWNGATNVATWTVLVGPDADHLEPVASAPRAGFETTINAPTAHRLVAVRAIDADGTTLGTSEPVVIGARAL